MDSLDSKKAPKLRVPIWQPPGMKLRVLFFVSLLSHSLQLRPFVLSFTPRIFSLPLSHNFLGVSHPCISPFPAPTALFARGKSQKSSSSRGDKVGSMPRGVKKENLPSKVCVTCGRPFTWRKKWERCWDEVTTCSKSCNAARRRGETGGGENGSAESKQERKEARKAKREGR